MEMLIGLWLLSNKPSFPSVSVLTDQKQSWYDGLWKKAHKAIVGEEDNKGQNIHKHIKGDRGINPRIMLPNKLASSKSLDVSKKKSPLFERGLSRILLTEQYPKNSCRNLIPRFFHFQWIQPHRQGASLRICPGHRVFQDFQELLDPEGNHG